MSAGQLSGPRRPAPAPPLNGSSGVTTDFAITAGGDLTGQGIELGALSKLPDDGDYKESSTGTGIYHSVQLPYEHSSQGLVGIRVDVEKGVVVR